MHHNYYFQYLYSMQVFWNSFKLQNKSVQDQQGPHSGALTHVYSCSNHNWRLDALSTTTFAWNCDRKKAEHWPALHFNHFPE